MSRLLRLFESASAVCLIILTSGLLWSRASNHPGAERGALQPTIENVEARRLMMSPQQLLITNSSAKVMLIEFSDFECPVCGRFANEEWPDLRADLRRDSGLGFIFMPFPLEGIHKQAFEAAKAGVCAGRRDHFWDMHDRLFSNQTFMDRGHIDEHARAIGLDSPAFDDCLEHNAASSVRESVEVGLRLGVRATPTFFVATLTPTGDLFIRRQLVGGRSTATLKTAVAQVLSE